MSQEQAEQEIYRIRREQEFHDKRFADDSVREKKVSRFYSVAQSIKHEYKKFLLINSKDARILEYGCGPGGYAFFLAQNGAKLVTGIDISEVAIEKAMTQAKSEGIGTNLSFAVMNAEELTFNESSIDLLCGSGILHHLDLGKAMDSIVYVLSPQGTAIFVEPLGHNILINLFRCLTPEIRSEDEHPLLERDLTLMKRCFKKVDIKYYYLTALAASLLVGLPGFKLVLGALEFLDRFLFKLPFLQKQAWQVLIKLSEPIKQ
ncbi:class I SAM-dependent methyltransferase [Anabaena azotica]|uniref:class I SAM-dependent methyltransferase n=1 Tax=Anabaena azotica TaxID=197653 RepID=UPI0039A5E683